MKNQYFPALTGLRAIAAFMVYIVHYKPFKVEKFGQFAFDFFNEFHIGVTIFFVLSGFLITIRYYNKDNFSFKSYFINRFARIYPIYFLLTTALFLYLIFYKSINYNTSNTIVYLLNITLLKAYFNDFAYTGIGQGWTLTVEETFYILAPLFFLLIKKQRYYLLLIPVIFLSIGLFFVEQFGSTNFYGFFKDNLFMLEMTFFGRCFEFFVGIALALLILKQKNPLKIKHLTFIGIFFIAVSLFWISSFKGENSSGMYSVFGIMVNNFFLPVFGIAPLIYGLIYENNIVSKILKTPLFTLLGKSSYVFYLIHLGVFATFLMEHLHNFILSFIFLNIIAIALYWYVEKPLNILIKKRFF